MSWLYQGKPFDIEDRGDAIGFVYLVENLTNGKLYVGKKTFYFTRKKMIKNAKGIKKPKRVQTDSDWVSYTGSSKALNEDILAGHQIQRTILHLCESVGMTSYLEAKEQFLRDVLLDPNYYNGYIQVRLGRLKS